MLITTYIWCIRLFPTSMTSQCISKQRFSRHREETLMAFHNEIIIPARNMFASSYVHDEWSQDFSKTRFHFIRFTSNCDTTMALQQYPETVANFKAIQKPQATISWSWVILQTGEKTTPCTMDIDNQCIIIAAKNQIRLLYHKSTKPDIEVTVCSTYRSPYTANCYGWCKTRKFVNKCCACNSIPRHWHYFQFRILFTDGRHGFTLLSPIPFKKFRNSVNGTIVI